MSLFKFLIPKSLIPHSLNIFQDSPFHLNFSKGFAFPFFFEIVFIWCGNDWSPNWRIPIFLLFNFIYHTLYLICWVCLPFCNLSLHFLWLLLSCFLILDDHCFVSPLLCFCASFWMMVSTSNLSSFTVFHNTFSLWEGAQTFQSELLMVETIPTLSETDSEVGFHLSNDEAPRQQMSISTMFSQRSSEYSTGANWKWKHILG